MKRVLSVLAICALLIAGVSTLAFAEDDAVTSLGIEATLNEDENGKKTVTAYVKLNDYTDGSWSAMTTVVNYDSDVLELVGVEDRLVGNYEGGLTWNSTVPGKLCLVWVGDAIPADDDTVIAVLTFDVKAVTEQKTIELTAGFAPSGMVETGKSEAMDNGENGEDLKYESTPTPLPEENEDIVIYPEGQEPGEEPDPEEPEEPTSNNQTVYNIVGPDNKVDFKIKATHQKADSLPMYKVNVSWETEGFVYTEKGTKWNPNEHLWVDTTPANWEGTGVIKLENHSAYAVIATFDYTPDGNDTMMEFKQGETLVGESGVSIDAPEVTPEGGETTSPGKAEVAAAITYGTIKTGGKVGTIKVTIA